MKLLVDYDDQYFIQHVEDPIWIPPKESKHQPRSMPPQMMRLIKLLEEKFLGRWAYVVEYRHALRDVDFSVRNTLTQRIWRAGKMAETQKMWEEAHEAFVARVGEDYYDKTKVRVASKPVYVGDASDTGPSAYGLFRRARSVLMRAGILKVRRSVKRRLGELLGRELLPKEQIVSGPPGKVLRAQVELMVTRGALGGMIVERPLCGNSNLGLAVVEDAASFEEYLTNFNRQQPWGCYVQLVTGPRSQWHNPLIEQD